MRFVAVVLAAVPLLASCGGGADAASPVTKADAVVTSTTTAPSSTSEAPSTATTVASSVPTKAAPPPTTAAPPPPTAPPTTAAPRVRQVTEQPYVPYATVRSITLHHPAARVEHVGFHQSNHDGAQDQAPAPTAVRPTTLEGRGGRVTAARTAADIVVDPASEIRSPVSGTVKRGGGYVLYCDTQDEFVVIEPDGQPGIEVKLLHVVGLQVTKGQHVDAGVTLLALHAHQLPFESQVDEIRTADPAWPHVHVEVVDTSIPDQPNPGSGC